MIDKSPDAFRTISEAAEYLDLPQHVLRFWETRFPQIKPLKRGGGRRYYRPDDVEFLRGLKHLLHAERYTIKGVQKIIKEQGQRAVQAAGNSNAAAQQLGNGAAIPQQASKNQPAPVVTAPIISRPVNPTPKPIMKTTPIAPASAPLVMPNSMRGKLEAAMAEMLECRRILAQLNAA
jgi:DNA-binding transcriptional MerR regulator